MAGIPNVTPCSSSLIRNSSVDSQWNLAFDAPERQFVETHPRIADALEAAAEILKNLTFEPKPFTSQIIVANVKKLDQNFVRSDRKTRQFYSSFLARRDLPVLTKTYIAKCLTSAGLSTVIEGSLGRSMVAWWEQTVCQHLRDFIWNLSDNGTDMPLAICKSGYLQDLVMEVHALTSVVNRTKNLAHYTHNDYFYQILSVLHNCSRCAPCVEFYHEYDVLTALRPLRRTTSDEIRYIVLTTSSNVARKEDRSFIVTDVATFQWIIKMLKSCCGSRKREVKSREITSVTFSEFELILSLESLTRIPENRRLPVTCGVLPVLLTVLQEGEEVARIQACGTLRNLSETAHVRRDVAAAGAAGVLRSIAGSEVSRDLLTAATDALAVMEGPS